MTSHDTSLWKIAIVVVAIFFSITFLAPLIYYQLYTPPQQHMCPCNCNGLIDALENGMDFKLSLIPNTMKQIVTELEYLREHNATYEELRTRYLVNYTRIKYLSQYISSILDDVKYEQAMINTYIGQRTRIDKTYKLVMDLREIFLRLDHILSIDSMNNRIKYEQYLTNLDDLKLITIKLGDIIKECGKLSNAPKETIDQVVNIIDDFLSKTRGITSQTPTIITTTR